MKKGQILLITILLTGGIFTSCENFLNGQKIKQQIEDEIALANAPAFPILIDGSKGKFSPSKGSYPIKVTQGMNIAFESDTDFEFIRWEVFNVMTGESLDSDGYIEFTDSKSDETSFKLLKEPGSEMQLGVRSIVSARPQIVSYTPNSLGMLKDSTIQILFNRDIDPDSIYYSEKERNELKVSERLSDSDFLYKLIGGEKKYYCYKKNGETFFKNIMLINNKTGDNINACFNPPVFESPRSLSISVNKKTNSGRILDDFTQVLVEVEKGFFYTEQEKPVEMAGSKMWMYQVNNRNDDKPLVIAKSGSTELFSAKFKSDNTDFIKSAAFALNKSGFGALKFIKNGNFKFDLNIEVQEQDGGSGPNSYFTVTVKKLYGVNYAASTYEKSFTLYYQTVTSDTAVFEGSVDLEQEKVSLGDGVYEVIFDFMDRSGNHLIYPSGSHFYFAVDTKAPEINTPTISSTNSTTYTLNWSDYVDLKTAEIIVTGSTSSSETITNGTLSGNITNIQPDKTYNVKVKFTDYAGNSIERPIPKFLTGYYIQGTLDFTKENASHAQNIFFAGDRLSNYGVDSIKIAWSNGSVENVVSSGYTIPNGPNNDKIYNSAWEIFYKKVENVSKYAVSGTYYIAKKDSLTQKPVYDKNYHERDNSGDKHYKFGDFPQTVSGISKYTSTTVYNGWYLGSDGYFYEKQKANNASEKKTFSNGTTVTNNKDYYFKVEPIYWRALTMNYNSTGKTLLFADKVLKAGIPFYLSQSTRSIGVSTVDGNSWKYSTMRAYLNGSYESGDPQAKTYSGNGFLQKAFTSSAQNLIATTSVDNNAKSTNPNNDPNLWNGGTNNFAEGSTNEKIFLLSMRELTIGDYHFNTSAHAGGAGNHRGREPSDYALSVSKYVNKDAGYGAYYWQRSSCYYSNCVRYVDTFGTADNGGKGVDENLGIVPALVLENAPPSQ